MHRYHMLAGLMTAVLAGCTGSPAETENSAEAEQQTSAAAPAPAPATAVFDWFEYSGEDKAFEGGAPDGGYLNPVLAGFYPDPSVTRAGDTYYLVTSTFSYFPGIPVMESKDLVSWTQIGNVIDRPGMLDFDGLGLSRGVFAPTIEFHDGMFYVANTCVDCGGNFIVTATDPAGPWSDPIWTPEVGGIDPSLFFDEDGKVWMMNNDEPEGGSTYDGHRAIWIREVDPQTFESISEPVMIIDGGVRPEDKPIWIEGPHIYKVGDWYCLSAAEGGTAVDHSQVVLRAKSVTGPYTPYEGNPVLTQRDLPEDRPDPITSVGHADLVQDADGQWWATFLGVRPYEGDFYNTGRETFLMPVEWTDGWPIITEAQETVPYRVGQKPASLDTEPAAIPLAGNFSVREDFDAEALPPHWMTLRVPQSQWWDMTDGSLLIEARPVALGAGLQPSVLARRQQHQSAEATTAVRFNPASPAAEAGLTVLQNDAHFYALGIGKNEAGETVIRLRKRTGDQSPVAGETIAETPIDVDGEVSAELRITAQGDAYDFSYRLSPENDWTVMAEGLDGKMLSTRTAGGFVGAVFGLYAAAAPA